MPLPSTSVPELVTLAVNVTPLSSSRTPPLCTWTVAKLLEVGVDVEVCSGHLANDIVSRVGDQQTALSVERHAGRIVERGSASRGRRRRCIQLCPCRRLW